MFISNTSYIEHCDLYTEIHGLIAVNSCQIELAQKDIILLSKAPIVTYKAGKPTGVENRNLIYTSITAGTYSTDDFKTKIKELVLQQRQHWEPPQMKDLKLVTPKHYTFLCDNTIFIELGIQDKYLEKTVLIRLILPLAHTKHPLIFFQDHCHCTVNKSTKLRTSWIVNHHVCCPPCMFLIIKLPAPQSI